MSAGPPLCSDTVSAAPVSSFREAKYIQHVHYLYPLELAHADELSGKQTCNGKKYDWQTAFDNGKKPLFNTYFSPFSQSPKGDLQKKERGKKKKAD